MLGICLDEQVIRLGTLTLGAVICRQSVVELAYVGLNAVVGKDILPTGKTEPKANTQDNASCGYNCLQAFGWE
jgi:hypothetical protein